MTGQSRLPGDEIPMGAGLAGERPLAAAATGPGKSRIMQGLMRKYQHPRYSLAVIDPKDSAARITVGGPWLVLRSRLHPWRTAWRGESRARQPLPRCRLRLSVRSRTRC